MEKANKPKVEIYTDGACSGNPGRGGYGAVLRFKKADGSYIQKELSEGFRLTTNNRMELLACIVALDTLKVPCEVVMTSDSKYLIDAFEKDWIKGWISKNWMISRKKAVKNKDLWLRLVELNKKHDIKFCWIKGHAGHKYNELCDRLAVEAYNQSDLKEDTEYISSLEETEKQMKLLK